MTWQAVKNIFKQIFNSLIPAIINQALATKNVPFAAVKQVVNRLAVAETVDYLLLWFNQYVIEADIHSTLHI